MFIAHYAYGTESCLQSTQLLKIFLWARVEGRRDYYFIELNGGLIVRTKDEWPQHY
jgi:hypothetical protein